MSHHSHAMELPISQRQWGEVHCACAPHMFHKVKQFPDFMTLRLTVRVKVCESHCWPLSAGCPTGTLGCISLAVSVFGSNHHDHKDS